jgi:hypothetical protein
VGCVCVCMSILLSLQGCAILYVDRKHHSMIHPLLVSWGDGYGFNSEFGWTGNIVCLLVLSFTFSVCLFVCLFVGMMDYCAYLSMHAGNYLAKLL